MPDRHPCDGVILPSPLPGRDRRLQDADQESGTAAEEVRIRAALAPMDDARDLLDVFELGLLTGTRRSETLILGKEEVEHAGGVWRMVKGRHKTLRLGHVRRGVLPPKAMVVVRGPMDGAAADGRLFTTRVDRFRHFFRKACRLAGMDNFRFHDTRHEGMRRMADLGLTSGELQAQSGHRTAQMLMRYVNARPKDILAKLA